MSSRRRVWPRVVGAVAVLGAIVLVVLACAPMSISSLRSTPAAQSIVADDGVYDFYTVEPNINVSPRCELRIEAREDITAAEFGALLARISGTDLAGGCEMGWVRWKWRAMLAADDWSGVSDKGWTIIADRMLRSGDLGVYRLGDGAGEEPDERGDWLFASRIFDDTLDEFLERSRRLLDATPVEPELGPTTWELQWTPDGDVAAWGNEIGIFSDETPGPEIAALLDAVAPVAAQLGSGTEASVGGGVPDVDDPVSSIGITVRIADGETHVAFHQVVWDWGDVVPSELREEFLTASPAADAARTLLAAVQESGVPVDRVSVEASDLRWGDPAPEG